MQLLADELVPLDDATVSELAEVIDVMRAAVPDLAAWRSARSPEVDWVLEPPLAAVGVSLTATTDLLDYANVARLRRSFEFLAPNSLALRKEKAMVVTDALLDLLVRVG